MQSQLLRKIVGFIAIAIGLVICALYLNSAVYHLWLADGPPVDDPSFHLKVFYTHAIISFIGFAVAAITFIIFWKKRKQSGGLG